jgi:hypothetical protein
VPPSDDGDAGMKSVRPRDDANNRGQAIQHRHANDGLRRQSERFGRNDFRYEDAQLYRTQKGSWFLAGLGGY